MDIQISDNGLFSPIDELLVSDLNSIQKPLNFLWFSAFIMSGDPFMRAFLDDSSLLISVFSPI